MTFRVGQKVVCVGKFPQGRREYPFLVFPEFNQVYTVRALVLGHDGVKEVPGVLVCEISNVIGPRGIEYNFDRIRFRPVVERKTSIEVFEKMLTGKRVDA